MSVLTTDAGPFEADLFWIMTDREGRQSLIVPMGAEGSLRCCRSMQARLAGFDNMAVVEADEQHVECRLPDLAGRRVGLESARACAGSAVRACGDRFACVDRACGASPPSCIAHRLEPQREQPSASGGQAARPPSRARCRWPWPSCASPGRGPCASEQRLASDRRRNCAIFVDAHSGGGEPVRDVAVAEALDVDQRLARAGAGGGAGGGERVADQHHAGLAVVAGSRKDRWGGS